MMDLTPDFQGIFKATLAEARRQGKAADLFRAESEREQVEALRDVQRFLAPLTTAALAMSSVEEVEAFRAALADILADIDRTATEMAQEA